MDLNGQTALVTGSSRGIGKAIAAELARRPLELLLCGMRGEGTPPVAPPGGAREVRTVELDLSTRESIEGDAGGLPPVDLLVNNAGLMTGGLLEEQETGDIYAMFQVNLVAVVHLTKLLLPGMVERGRGTIVNNASISGYAWFPAATTYAAAKTGVVAFSESLRRELDGTGVSVLHLVTPGVDTDMLDATREVYGRHMDADSWGDTSPEEWAAKVVRAVERGDHVLGPGGRLALAKLASRGPAALLDTISRRMFSRDAR
ncbi:MAG TPA: SDR family NAD(P)-dependent oxidoreductase [Thermoleophilaceae bacterium]|nr:SDR family NAD(P)-dependent oxidoreductase [Thermoleophilaceae bacterium]